MLMDCSRNLLSRRLVALVLLTSLAMASRGDDGPGPPETLETARKSKRLTRLVTVDVRLAKPEATFAILEPIRLHVVAHNVSDHTPMAIFNTAGRFSEECNRRFPTKVFDGKGLLARRTRYGEFDVKFRGLPIGGGINGSTLNPGHEDTGDLVANLIFDMTSPGDYTILVEYPCYPTNAYDDNTERPVIAQSEPIKVKVLDRLP